MCVKKRQWGFSTKTCLPLILWKAQPCSKCHFISALCSVSRISLQCNNYTAKCKRVSAVRVIQNTEFLVNKDEMKGSVYMMALNLRLRGILRVDPCHPLAYKLLHLGCVKFKSRWSTQSHSSLPIGILHDPIPSFFFLLAGLCILTYYLVLELFFQLEIMQFLINCIPRPIILHILTMNATCACIYTCTIISWYQIRISKVHTWGLNPASVSLQHLCLQQVHAWFLRKKSNVHSWSWWKYRESHKWHVATTPKNQSMRQLTMSVVRQS